MRMRHSAVKPRFHSTRSALLVVYTTVTSCRPSTPVTHIVALTLLHLQHGRPLHILLSTPQSRFSETANPLEWFDPIRSHTGTCSSHSRVSRRWLHGRLACPNSGFSLGPVQFIWYMECSVDVFSVHGLQYHMFADDTQAFDYCPVTIMHVRAFNPF